MKNYFLVLLVALICLTFGGNGYNCKGDRRCPFCYSNQTEHEHYHDDADYSGTCLSCGRYFTGNEDEDGY